MTSRLFYPKYINVMHGVRKKKPERPGFEPGVEFYPYNCLAGSCLQPLGNISLIPEAINLEGRLLISRLWRGGTSAAQPPFLKIQSVVRSEQSLVQNTIKQTPCFYVDFQLAMNTNGKQTALKHHFCYFFCLLPAFLASTLMLIIFPLIFSDMLSSKNTFSSTILISLNPACLIASR